MHLTPAELRCVHDVLARHLPGYEVWAFGSRVHGQHLKPFSDLDLIIIDSPPISLDTLASVKTAFSDSQLPFRVDVLSWAGTSEQFRKIVAKEHFVIQTTPR